MTLTLVALGGGGHDNLTLGALEILRDSSQPRLVRQRDNPAVAWLESPEGGVVFDTAFDDFTAPSPDTPIAAAIADYVLRLAGTRDVLYAVPVARVRQDPSCARILSLSGGVPGGICIVPPEPEPEEQPTPDFDTLVRVMARLRDPLRGCPWDLEQTPATLKRYLIEESYEVLEAIDLGHPAKLCEELGDLLLQVVFHAQLTEEAHEFNIDDVCRIIVEKLIRRHPHVFGTVSVAGSEEVLVNWEQIKRAEAGNADRTSILDGIPKGLPALLRAAEVSKRVVKVGFEWPSITEVFEKVDEELAELRAEIESGATERAAEELGDVLFTLVNVARHLKIDSEEALRQMTERFANRFRHIENHAAATGRSVSDLPLSEMEAVWQAAKKASL